jgi:hypothetical protein
MRRGVARWPRYVFGQADHVTALTPPIWNGAALEVMIAHVQSHRFKAEHRMTRNIAPNFLRGGGGDPINAVFVAAGHNYGLSCADWPGFCAGTSARSSQPGASKPPNGRSAAVLHGSLNNPSAAVSDLLVAPSSQDQNHPQTLDIAAGRIPSRQRYSRPDHR